MKRAAALAGVASAALSVVVAAGPIASASVSAEQSYRGTWELTAWNIDGTNVQCPGTLPVASPAPAIECAGGEFLKLTKDFRYKSNLSVFQSMKHPKGDFAVLQLPNSSTKTIVFYSDSARRDPRAYNMKLRKSADGRESMIISLEFSVGPGKDTYIEMIFIRNAT